MKAGPPPPLWVEIPGAAGALPCTCRTPRRRAQGRGGAHSGAGVVELGDVLLGCPAKVHSSARSLRDDVWSAFTHVGPLKGCGEGPICDPPGGAASRACLAVSECEKRTSAPGSRGGERTAAVNGRATSSRVAGACAR